MSYPPELERYKRNIGVEAIGVRGQLLLADSSVLIIGAGGLGSPAALYLAAAGVGCIGVADPDKVELSNLQRQILHNTASLGDHKVFSAARTLKALNPDVRVITYRTRFGAENAESLVEPYDVVLGATDSIKTRFLLNETCVKAKKPLVDAGVCRFEGLVLTVVPEEGPCYRCLFDPRATDNSGCEGVLGPLAGVMGSLQALEVIKLLTGTGKPLVGRALLFDGYTMSFKEVRFQKDPDCPVCGKRN